MKPLLRVRLALLILAAALFLAACNLPSPAPPPGGSASATPASDPPALPGSADPTPIPPGSSEPTATTAPLPDPPAGWSLHDDAALGLSLYVPPGWEVAPVSPTKLDVRQTGAEGWIEVNILDESNAFEWSLSYVPGMDAQAILESLLVAAREDGSFDAVQPYQLRTGATAWVAEGTYDVLSERVLIGVIGLPERALIVVGHAPQNEDGGWDAGLITMYQTILWAVQPQ